MDFNEIAQWDQVLATYLNKLHHREAFGQQNVAIDIQWVPSLEQNRTISSGAAVAAAAKCMFSVRVGKGRVKVMRPGKRGT